MAKIGRASDGLQVVDARIAWVLEHPRISDWLKAALRTGLKQDPIQVLNDLEILRQLLSMRSDALVRLSLGPKDDHFDPYYRGNYTDGW